MELPASLERAQVPDPVMRVAQRLSERGFRAFLVGGCIRDALRGVPPKDWDVATSARPEDVQRSFDKVIPTGIQHGTVTVLLRGAQVEVTTFRSEGAYLDGRRPSAVEFKANIAEDLSRRDFTINAIAFDPVRRELADPFGGQQDLERRLIRCVGDPLARFSEDGLRALRAVRFAAVLGFDIDPNTFDAIAPTLPIFKKVSHERIRDELQKLLLSDRPALGLRLLQRSGLLAAFLPEVSELSGFGEGLAQDLFAFCASAVQHAPASLEVRLAALLSEVARPRTVTRGADGAVSFPDHERLGERMGREALSRLKFPNKVTELAALLVREHAAPIASAWSDGQARRFIARVGPSNLPALLALMEAQRRALGEPPRLEELARFRVRLEALLADKPPLEPRALALDGGDVMRLLGVGPSPVVGEATRLLMDLVFDDPGQNTPEKLADALRKWAKNRGL